MSNNLLVFIEIIAIFTSLLTCKKLFGKNGVIAFVAVASVIANIVTAKSIELFGMSTVCGNVLFASTFLATDILSECYGRKQSAKAVLIGLFSVLMFIVCTQISNLYIPNEIDFADGVLKTLFSTTFRISASSIVMYFIANMADVFLFDKLKQITGEKYLWLRNNASTIICNGLENFLFMFLAFYGVYSNVDIVQIALSTTIIESIIAICDTPFLYIAKNMKELRSEKLEATLD